MKLIAWTFVMAAALGCKKSSSGSTTETVIGSGTGSGSATGPETTGGTMNGSAGNTGSAGSAAEAGSAGSVGSAVAANFDDKLVLDKQPKRSKAEQDRVDAATAALQSALTAAKNATESEALCKELEPLRKKLEQLQNVPGPAEQRDTLLQDLDAVDLYCGDPSNAPLDVLRDTLDGMRTHYIEFVSAGA